jgi:hypothetical protein
MSKRIIGNRRLRKKRIRMQRMLHPERDNEELHNIHSSPSERDGTCRMREEKNIEPWLENL